jgi:nucleoside-diphosphate-sugar epimerase
MRVFVTGASGHIGSAVVPELLSHGHEVVGLARSEASADLLADWGAEVRRGDLDDLDGLQQAASEADGVIHLAFKHEAMQSGDYLGAIDADLQAIIAMGDALAGSGKPYVTTSGTLMLAFGGIAGVGTEDDAVPAGPRVDAENLVVAMADRDIRSAVIRLPPTVHSELDLHGFIPTLIASARAKGSAAYIGDGENRWPSGHTLDAAALYRLAIEQAPAGSRLHAVGDEGVPVRVMAESIGRHLDLPVASVTPEDAGEYVGFLAPFLGLDNPTASVKTQQVLGWQPAHPGLLADLDAGFYFRQT